MKNDSPARTQGGPREPVASTPPRAPGSLRRTTTIDSARPDGWAGSVHVTARARDLLTPRAGAPVVLAEEGFTAKLSPDRVLREVVHGDPRMRSLLGTAVAGGFRARSLEVFAGEAERCTLLNLLLDDLPGASLVAGYALQRDAAWPARPVAFADLSPMHDLCAGWATDATILQAVRADGFIPVPTTAPLCAGEEADPDAWHDRPPLPAGGMRRARRLDVAPDDAGGGTFSFAVHFRDSHHDPVDGEGAVHEYELRGRFAAVACIILELDATASVLPWNECPRALASVPRVVGGTTDDLRLRVRSEFTGTSTCTHLNDVLRSLADLPVLASAVACVASRT
jgi:Protein of unknown function (DUF2889)